MLDIHEAVAFVGTDSLQILIRLFTFSARFFSLSAA